MHQTEWATQSSSNTYTTSDSNQTTNSFRQINIPKSNHQETLSESSKMLTLMFISKECAAYSVPIQSRQHVIAQVLGRVEGERSTSPASPVSPLPACRDSTWGSGPCPPTLKHQGHWNMLCSPTLKHHGHWNMLFVHQHWNTKDTETCSLFTNTETPRTLKHALCSQTLKHPGHWNMLFVHQHWNTKDIEIHSLSTNTETPITQKHTLCPPTLQHQSHFDKLCSPTLKYQSH